MKMVNIGFGNAVSSRRIIAIVSPESAPIKRLGQEAREGGVLIDASFGRKTKSVLIMDSGHIIWSSLSPEILIARCREEETNDKENEDDKDERRE